MKFKRFIDEFGYKGKSTGDKAPPAPAPPVLVLEYNKELEDLLPGKNQTLYRSGVGVLLHTICYCQLDILNRVRELSSYMREASRECYKAMIRVMSYIVATRELGFIFRPNRPNSWDGKKDSQTFVILGKDSRVDEWSGYCSGHAHQECSPEIV